MNNISDKVIKDFGDEWKAYNQDNLTIKELNDLFENYFQIFPFEKIKNIKEVLDSGDKPTTQQEKPGKISTDLFDELFGDKK